MDENDQKHPLLLFSLGEGLYAAHVAFIREIVADRKKIPLPNAPEYIPGIFNLRTEVIKVIDIRLIIPLADGGRKKKVIVFIPETGESTRFGIVVDEVYGIMEVPAREVTSLDLAGGKVSNNFMMGFFSFSLSGFLGSASRHFVPGTDEVVWIDFEDIIRTITGEKESDEIVFRLTALFNPDHLLSGAWKKGK